jgi:hypothetical protein
LLGILKLIKHFQTSRKLTVFQQGSAGSFKN